MTGDEVLTAGDRIRNLLGTYCDLMDAGDWSAVGELFSDANLVDDSSGDVMASGADGVEGFYSSTVILHDGSPRTNHLVLNTILEEPDASGVVIARSSYLVLQAVGAEAPRPMITGRYVDRLWRGPGGTWRFVERRFTVGLVGDLSQHLRFDLG